MKSFLLERKNRLFALGLLFLLAFSAVSITQIATASAAGLVPQSVGQSICGGEDSVTYVGNMPFGSGSTLFKADASFRSGSQVYVTVSYDNWPWGWTNYNAGSISCPYY